MKFNLKNRPKLYTEKEEHYYDYYKETEAWFEGFEKELREIIRKTLDGEVVKGVYVVTYVDKRPPTIYINIKEILGIE